MTVIVIFATYFTNSNRFYEKIDMIDYYLKKKRTLRAKFCYHLLENWLKYWLLSKTEKHTGGSDTNLQFSFGRCKQRWVSFSYRSPHGMPYAELGAHCPPLMQEEQLCINDGWIFTNGILGGLPQEKSSQYVVFFGRWVGRELTYLLGNQS